MSKNKQAPPVPKGKVQPQETRRETQIQRYFIKYINPEQTVITQKSLKTTEKMLAVTQRNFRRKIRTGEMVIKPEPDNLNEILIKEKIDEEEIKTEQLRKKRDSLVQALKRLDMRQKVECDSSRILDKRYSQVDNIKFVPGVLSKEEHENLMEKIRTVQEEIDMNHQRTVKQLQDKLAIEEANIKLAQQQKFKHEKELRRMKSQHNMGIRRESHQRKMMQNMQANRYLEHLKNSPPLYVLKQQKFNQEVVAPTLQQKKQKLKEIREFNKNFSVKDINNHQKKYIQERNLSMKQSKIKAKIEEQWIYKPPQKTDQLAQRLQEELTQKKLKLEEKKKNVDQKILRQQNYVRLLKEKYYPQKTNPELKLQLEDRLQKLHTQRRLSPSKTTREIGIQNLKIAKHKRQHSSHRLSVPSKLEKSDISERKKPYEDLNYLHTKKDDPEYYLRLKQEKINKLLEDKSASPEKVKNLETEAKKLQQALAMKKQLLKISNTPDNRNQAAQLYLSEIKAKMGLIRLYQNSPN